MTITHAQANTIVALASSMASAHLGTCVTRPDRCPSMITTDSARRNKVAERELIEFLDSLIPVHHLGTQRDKDEYLAWQDLRAATGLLKGMK